MNYGMERVWCMACKRGANQIAIGYDEGSVILKVGVSGVVWSKLSGGSSLHERQRLFDRMAEECPSCVSQLVFT